MVIGALISIALIAVGMSLNPLGLSQGATVTQRLSVVSASATLLALCLAVSIGRLARHRFFTPEDINGTNLHHNSDRANQLQSLLQNTLEQSVLASIVYFSWAVTMPASSLTVVPLAAVGFAVGRVLFFFGYDKGAPARALGFALTFYPSLVMLLCNGVYLSWSLFRTAS